MAGFKTHITTSTVLGIGYGTVGFLAFGVRPETCLLATGLCSFSGMLPDLDSDSGVPLRECIAFGAAVVPMLLINVMQQDGGWPPDLIVLAGALVYIAIRFGLAEILKRYTVHRGMWHSIPAAAIAGLLAFLLCSHYHGRFEQLYKVAAVVLGFMSHLILDEIYSIEWKCGVPRLKRSFGTAVKFWSNSVWANISTYGKLLILIALVVWTIMNDPNESKDWEELRKTAENWMGTWLR